MSGVFPPESDLAPFTPWGIAVGEPLHVTFQWCDLAEDGITVVPYPIPDGERIELRITWESGAPLVLSTDPDGGITVEDQSDASWIGMFSVDLTEEQLASLPTDRPVLFRFRSQYEGTPMTILRGEIYLDREAR